RSRQGDRLSVRRDSTDADAADVAILEWHGGAGGGGRGRDGIADGVGRYLSTGGRRRRAVVAGEPRSLSLLDEGPLGGGRLRLHAGSNETVDEHCRWHPDADTRGRVAGIEQRKAGPDVSHGAPAPAAGSPPTGP